MLLLSRLRELYYGWWIAIVGALLVGWIGGVGYLSYGVFIIRLEGDFHWNKTQLAFVSTISTILAGVAIPLIGLCIDRYGPKKVLLVGVVWMGLGLILFSRVKTLWMLYLVWPAMVNLGTYIAEYAPNAAAVAKWFIWYRGVAMGILSGLGGIVAVWVPFLLVTMVAKFDWQVTALMLGIFTIAYGLLLGQVHRSKPPEAYGLKPDGMASDRMVRVDEAVRQRTEAAAEFTVKEAVGTRAFWLLGVGGMLSGPAFSALMLFLLPIMQEKGVSFQMASLGWVAFYAGSIPARFIMGSMEGKFEPRLVLLLATMVEAVSFLLFLAARSASAMYLVLWIFGVGSGSRTPLSMSITASYFGRTNYASIRGWLSPFQTVGGAVGPLLLGWLFTRTESFGLGIAIIAAFTASGGVLFYFAKKPGVPTAVPNPTKVR